MLLTTIMHFFLHLHRQYYHAHDGRNNAFWIYAVWSYHLHSKNCFASSNRPIIIWWTCILLSHWLKFQTFMFDSGRRHIFFPRKNWCIPSGYENYDLSAAERRTNIYPLDQKYDICWVDTEKNTHILSFSSSYIIPVLYLSQFNLL